MRPKRLTTLQTINHSLQNSILQTKRGKGYNSTQKKDGSMQKKTIFNPYTRKFHIKKQPKADSESAQKKDVLRRIRMHTEKQKQNTVEVFKTPDRKKGMLRSETVQARMSQNEEKYSYLTQFQKEEIAKYEVYYIGPRRIASIRDFTSNNCQAKVSAGDSIAYRYQIISGLGQGSFGQVFKAFDHRKQEIIAIKIIRNEAKFNRQAKVQIKILQTVILQDPKFRSNIVQLKHGFFFRGHACLVFQLLHVNLYQILKQTKFRGLKLDYIRKISLQVLHSLLFLKKHNIIHCDLKPQNILLKQENRTGIKVIDVGSGCYESEQIYTYIQSRYYRAPEVILGIRYTTAIDIWSLGCVICELFLGHPIFPGENQHDQILRFMQVIGQPSIYFLQEGSRSHKFFDERGIKNQFCSKGKLRKPNSTSFEKIFQPCGDVDFIDFIKKMLVWDPEQRITPAQAMLSTWVIKGLPDELRKQHIQSVERYYDLSN